ncbi:MAG: hypothetical protein GY906_23865 [bacterium]|nr:hypothetical protein [bacterium]
MTQDISQDKEACAEAYLHSGQMPRPRCVGCGKEFNSSIRRCAEDFIHCVMCRVPYAKKHRKIFLAKEIPLLEKRLERYKKEYEE